MAKIALIGYGRMGKAIEEIIQHENSGHSILYRIDKDNRDLLKRESLKKADVAIEFTRPETAVSNIISCFEAGVPVVSGTTGWLSEWDKVTEQCKKSDGSFFYASNFSVGVNIFFALNQFLAEAISDQKQYEVLMEEIHHTEKLDAPSGTAITLAEGIIRHAKKWNAWKNDKIVSDNEISIISKRETGVPGTHTVAYTSAEDTIEIRHTAHSRKGFALGAVKAALWLINKKGIFGMPDMLNN